MRRVAARIGQAENWPASPQIFIEFGWDLVVAASILQNQQRIGRQHLAQRLAIRQRCTELNEILYLVAGR